MRPYEVSAVGFPDKYNQVLLAPSAGNAKYRRWLDLKEAAPDLKITDMRCRVAGEIVEPPGFREVCERRGIPFARVGMRVTVDGRKGVIVGHNDSANLDVLFGGVVGNCHPHWRVAYFDSRGRTIAEYGDGKLVERAQSAGGAA